MRTHTGIDYLYELPLRRLYMLAEKLMKLAGEK